MNDPGGMDAYQRVAGFSAWMRTEVARCGHGCRTGGQRLQCMDV